MLAKPQGSAEVLVWPRPVWKHSAMADTSWTRRRFALTSGLGTLVLSLSRASWAVAPDTDRTSGAKEQTGPQERWIELKSIHTGEVVKATFDKQSGPDRATLAKLQHLLRDYRVNEEHTMDSRLYELLSDLAQAAGHEPRFEVISGYRSPRTNAQLRARGHGVAERSLHMEGRAIDVRLKGCDCAMLRDLALQAKRGGVGYYARSNFVHLDTGRVRTWNG
jgi:uncharacterized protein YcbK (DUF882 family)